ncbi:hypothetical protein HH310_12355 [Actinoplanes sp. TBRC 11911]|uniref:hypothetical protein n=1 Tax=Actinoplanes sp. TBRC 11911 TaxID=2729386 RepID=UPI00145CC6EE|nr:hypothetical protein [Actinoplanes sp. TBRC 11911]NMO51985.1 hypothetical protein [Actinoplanes sp. TBRC 11911]
MNEPTTKYLLLEARLGQKLTDYVAGQIGAGAGWKAIAADLSKRTDVPVSRESLRVWFSGRVQTTAVITDVPAESVA